MHDPHLHLLVDDDEIETSENLSRVLNRPRRHAQPVLKADRPWEGGRVQAWGSVIKESDGLLRLWYLGIPNDRPLGWKRICFCYAESRDGFNWEKPSLKREAWNGSTDNNLFYSFGDDECTKLALRGEGLMVYSTTGEKLFVVNNLDGMTVIRDDTDPDPQRRYKMIGNMQDHRMWAWAYPKDYPGITKAMSDAALRTWTQCLDTSPDGLTWTKRPTVLMEAKYGDYMMVARDQRNNQWWMNQRPPSSRGRAAGLRYGKDLYSFTDPPEAIFQPDAESANGKKFEWHGGITPFNYGSLDLGFLEKWANVGSSDVCELVSHRDGKPWRRVMPGQPFLDVGPEDSFDRCLAYPTHNPPIVMGDKLMIFYTGGGMGSRERQDYSAAIGVMTIGLDRFAGMANARRAAGTLVTKPLLVSEETLQINVEAGLWSNGVRVAILNPDGSEIPGYKMAECQPVTTNAVRAPVRWKNEHHVANLRDKPVKLKFEIAGATLYAFRFSKDDD